MLSVKETVPGLNKSQQESVMFNPPHPGALLKSAIRALNISAQQFASHIGVPTASVTGLLKEETSLSPEMAVRLAKAISGPDAVTWLRMQADYDAWHASRNTDVSFIKPLDSAETSGPSHEGYSNIFDCLVKTAPEEPISGFTELCSADRPPLEVLAAASREEVNGFLKTKQGLNAYDTPSEAFEALDKL